jgi:ribosomal-protein-alanine N-acetyltransferase
MLTPIITPAHRDDSRALAALARRLIEIDLAPVWTEQRFERARHHPDHLILIARSGRTRLGFAAMEYRDEGAHLNLLAVEPSYQRRGIGRALLEQLAAAASAGGATCLRLEVRAANLGAQAFYRAAGFQDSGRRMDYYRLGEDALCFLRPLNMPTASRR